MPTERPDINHLLVLPRLRIQNANAISSPLTWGFPSITAFTGLMHALQRRLGAQTPFAFRCVGVICHHLEAQVATGKHEYSFNLTRNPVDRDGSTPAIVEEGRVHLDITLVFGLHGADMAHADHTTLQHQACLMAEALAGMRVAGGSVMPALSLSPRQTEPTLLPWPLHYQPDEHARAWRRLSRRWLPGFALVARDDLLASQLADLRTEAPDASLLDAWLNTVARTQRARHVHTPEVPDTPDAPKQVEWQTERRPGWIVPIPVGYAALSALHAAGTVARARDGSTPLRFVESVYSLGQWISPHRLGDATELLWWLDHDAASGLYRCRNGYRASAPTTLLAPAHPDPVETLDDPDSPFNYV